MASARLLSLFSDVIGSTPAQQYRHIKPLNDGSFATVWLLQDNTTEKYVVGKVSDTNQMNERNRQFALAESRTISMCIHPNIIQYIESFERSGVLLLIFEYADGGDMYLQVQARLPTHCYFHEEELLIIMAQLGLAIQYLHSRRIMHRDLKTQNVFLLQVGLIKLGDFGLSRQYELPETANVNPNGQPPPSTGGGSSAHQEDMVGATYVGTPFYLAPELWRRENYSFKADMWSLGVVLYELMTLSKPFQATSMEELMGMVLNGAYGELPQRYSPELRSLASSLLCVVPSERPTMRDVLRMPIMRRGALVLLRRNIVRLIQVPSSIKERTIQQIDELLAEFDAEDVAMFAKDRQFDADQRTR